MLLRRALVEWGRGYEESFRDLYEDQVFAAKICRTTPVYISGQCWYRYRQHPNSCCQTAEREGRLAPSREPFLRWLLEYLEREDLAGSDAWRLVRVELGLERQSPLLVWPRGDEAWQDASPRVWAVPQGHADDDGGPRSVILPFLNAERFMEEAIESVTAQTYPNWELLLVDDGSTDGSTEIARKYVGSDPTG